MTLIIGIQCSDGVVVAADGAASFSSATGLPTATQPVQKLTAVCNTAIVGVAGPVGIAQRMQPLIHDMVLKNEFSPKGATIRHPADAMGAVGQKIWPLLRQELQIAGEAAQAIGNMALQQVCCAMLMAVPVSKVPCLFQFDYKGSSCHSTRDLTFFSIGSGEQVADPFLAFIRRNLWPDRLPNIAEATFAAYWTLDYAIKGTPNVLIGDPKQIMLLEEHANSWRTRELTAEDLQEHKQSIEAAHDALRSFRKNMAPETDDETVPSPPSPPEMT